MKVHSNPQGIKMPHYFGYMAALNDEDGLLFTWESCKESFLYFFCGTGIMRAKTGFACSRYRNGSVDFHNPKFVMCIGFGNTVAAPVDERFYWVEDAMDAIAEEFTAPISVSRLGNTAIVVVEPDPFFIKNSVILHFLLTFIRSSAFGQNMRKPHNSKDIMSLLEDMTAQTNVTKNDRRQILDSPNVASIIDKSLPIFEEDGLMAWFKAEAISGLPSTPGICSYRPDMFKSNEYVSQAALIKEFGRAPDPLGNKWWQ